VVGLIFPELSTCFESQTGSERALLLPGESLQSLRWRVEAALSAVGKWTSVSRSLTGDFSMEKFENQPMASHSGEIPGRFAGKRFSIQIYVYIK
jgi:hypothetical protein